MPKLIAEDGKLKGLTLSLDEGEEWLIGRDPEVCQLLIQDPLASRKHLICRKEPGGISVENLCSTNPIQINQQEVSGEQLLHEGDTLKVGNTLFRFYSDNNVKNQAEEPQDNNREVEAAEKEAPASSDNGDKKEKSQDEQESKAEEPQENEEKQDSEEQEEYAKRRDTLFDENEDSDELLAEIDFDIQETERWLLKVIGGPNNGAEFTMTPGKTYSLGTDPATCDIIFHDTSVSRQHAKIQVLENDTISIEDLKSRNGTLIDGEKVEGKKIFNPNSVVSLGTTSFVIFDREGEMQTIISPLLPSIVRFLQKEEEAKPKEESVKEEPLSHQEPPMTKEELKEKAGTTLTAFILIGMLTGLFALTALGVVTLFKSEPVQVHEVVDTEALLKDALEPFPTVQYYYNKNNGTLLLVGHVLTENSRKQLLYNLQGIIKNPDDSGLIVDEYVWQALNPILANRWRGVTIQATTPGNFVLTGYLKTRAEYEDLYEYLNANFNYLDLLQNRVVVEENVANTIRGMIQGSGFKTLKPEFLNGDLSLKGSIPTSKKEDYLKLMDELKAIPGVHQIQDFVTETEPEKSLIDITNRYEVSGISRRGATLSVVIDGRIVSKGDLLDGMRIVEISPSEVLLEREGVRYRIRLR